MPRHPTRPPDGPSGPPPWAHGPPPTSGHHSGERWLIIEYASSWDADTLYIALTTDIACHLTLQWTDKETQLHLHEKAIRGLAVMGDPKFCFVQWQAVEQAEAGDTLSHTFNFASWVHEARRWWTFWGTQEDVKSPSNAPIFSAIYLHQEAAISLKHTDLIDKDPEGVIDHADNSVTGDKLVDDLEFGTFPTTPDANPNAALEVANKRYVDAAGDGALWVEIETITFDTVQVVDFDSIPAGYALLRLDASFIRETPTGDNVWFTLNADGGNNYSHLVISLAAGYLSVPMANQPKALFAHIGQPDTWVHADLTLANHDSVEDKEWHGNNSNGFSSLYLTTGRWHGGGPQIDRITITTDLADSLTGQITLSGIPAS